MSILEKKECLDRARAACLENVKTLNCWGSDLMDISIIEQMINLEVLNVSVNNIVSLKNFAYCPRLKEIYMRKNKVASLEELKYLKKLPQLKVVWLSDNPCSENMNYRNTVLRNLPNLQKLDSIAVTSEELRIANAEGQVIEDVDLLPDYTGLNLDQTLTTETIQKFRQKHKPDLEEKSGDLSELKSNGDINLVNEDRGQDQAIKMEKVPDHFFQRHESNTLSAVLLLLEELSATELTDVKCEAEKLIKSKSVFLDKLED